MDFFLKYIDLVRWLKRPRSTTRMKILRTQRMQSQILQNLISRIPTKWRSEPLYFSFSWIITRFIISFFFNHSCLAAYLVVYCVLISHITHIFLSMFLNHYKPCDLNWYMLFKVPRSLQFQTIFSLQNKMDDFIFNF